MITTILTTLSFILNANHLALKEINKYSDILIKHDIPCHIFTYKIKTFESALIKHAKPEYKDKSIYDLHDLVSFRFVFYKTEDLYKFWHHNRDKKTICYLKNYIQEPKKNGYKALHFHYITRQEPVKIMECQLYVIEDYYDSIYGNSSKYKNYQIY